MLPENKTLIGTLRIKGATDSTPALRLSISSLLATADLWPMGISPSAILIVRNLADPLPGRLKPQPGVVKVDADWERAMQDSLTGMYHTAARPVNGYIPPDAKAVLFADEGEMLACLALDVSRKEAAGRWWWKVILKRFPSGDLSNLLSSRANYVPAVLHHLAEWGQAVTVVSALSREEVMTVISALNRVYGLQEPESRRTDTSPLLQFNTMQEVEPPWEKWLLSAPQQLSKEREYLLGLGLSLYHEPASVKTHAFLRDLRTWLVYRESTSVGTEYLPEDAAVRKIEREKADVPAQFIVKGTDRVSRPASFQQKSTSDESDYLPGNQTSRIRISGTDQEDAGVRKIELDKVPTPLSFQQEEMGEHRYKDTAEYIPDDVKEKPAESIELIRKIIDTVLPGKDLAGFEKEQHLKPESSGKIPEEGVFTQLGGVLYLINMMRHLDLPACFEEEWRLASQLGSWGVLEVLARVLAKDDDPATDPLWNVLAELGGRDPGELSGETFCGSESYHIPMSWLNSDELIYYWAADRQQLRLWSDNWLLVDCPRDESTPLMQARNELGRYLDNDDSIELSSRPFDDAPIETVTGPMIERMNPDLTRWLSMVMPYIRHRLRSAFGPVTSDDPERDILHVQGWLYVTSTHVDLVMNMDEISIAVRLAGLDRDPGWLSDFGRVVQFHFE